eukprot:586913-Rhodomonas_salina.2
MEENVSNSQVQLRHFVPGHSFPLFLLGCSSREGEFLSVANKGMRFASDSAVSALSGASGGCNTSEL